MIMYIIIYSIFMFIYGIIYIFSWIDSHDYNNNEEEQKYFARQLVLTPVWPLGLVPEVKKLYTFFIEKKEQLKGDLNK